MGPRSVVVAASAVGALLVAGCSGGEDSPAPVTTTDQAGRTTVITPTPTPEPTAPDDAGPTTAVGVEMREVTLGPVRMRIPRGWEVQEMADLPGSWCLVPQDPLGPAVDGCAGLLVSHGDPLPGPEGEVFTAGTPDGWTVGSRLQPCPDEDDSEADGSEPDGSEPDGSDGDGAPATSTPQPGSTPAAGEPGAEDPEGGDPAAGDSLPGDAAATTAVPDPLQQDVMVTASDGEALTYLQLELAGHPATYETWRVTCSLSEETFAPQAWYVPDLELVIRDVLGNPETVLVLESLEEVPGADD